MTTTKQQKQSPIEDGSGVAADARSRQASSIEPTPESFRSIGEVVKYICARVPFCAVDELALLDRGGVCCGKKSGARPVTEPRAGGAVACVQRDGMERPVMTRTGAGKR